jgi:hypothetical protein
VRAPSDEGRGVISDADASEEERVKPLIECLRCGARRAEAQVEPDCPRCGYLGWACVSDLDERTRRLLRERPPEQRRLRRVA